MFKFSKFFNTSGEYIPSDEPMALPIGFQHPVSLAEQVARLVRSEELFRQAKAQGKESFEEADDFDVDDDFDPRSPWEHDFDLSSVLSVQNGITESPDNPRHRNAKKRTRKRFFKPSATPPAQSHAKPSLSPQGLASDEGASASPTKDKA